MPPIIESRERSRKRIALAVALAVPVSLQAQPPAAPTQGPSFRIGVDLVVVEATVVDREGALARGLRPSDFEVEIGGRSREVVSADLVEHRAGRSPAGHPDITTNYELAAGRTILLVIDQTSLRSQSRGVLDGARRWLSALAAEDRVGLATIPATGPRVEFTTEHERVREALARIAPAPDAKSPLLSVRNVSVSEGLGIYHGDVFLRAEVVNRECRGDTRLCPADIDMAARDIFMDAQFRMRSVLPVLGGLVRGLATLPGLKHVVLISSGWPIDARSAATDVSPIAAEASRSNAIVHTFTADTSTHSASARQIPTTPVQDRELLMGSVEMVSGLTGGEAVRAVDDGDTSYETLTRAMAGHYRLGVRPTPDDLDGTARRISVKVTARGLSLRSYRKLLAARATPVPALADDGAATRAALENPALSTALDLRATSYVLHDEANTFDRVRVLVVGDVARATAGPATSLAALYDLDGRPVANGGQRLDVRPEAPAQFQAAFRVRPGSYRLRVAVRDAGGLIGTVERDVEARWVKAGPVDTTGLVLLRSGHLAAGVTEPVLDRVSPAETVIAQLVLGGPGASGHSEVLIELTREGDSAPLISRRAQVVQTTSGVTLARDVLPTALLPPGRYSVGASVLPDPVRRFTRAFTVEAPAATAPDPLRPASSAADAASALPVDRAGASAALLLAASARFSIETVLDPRVLAAAFDRLASRPDTAEVREAIQRLGTGPWPTDAAAGPLSGAPVAAMFVAGLGRLRDGELEGAASDFRAALRIAPDFGPALVYLGACYAAGSRDKEAAGAWQTALLREKDWPDLARLAIDAWLRAGRPAAALALSARARSRWPADQRFVGQHARAALAAGRKREALDVVMGLGDPDEPLLLLALAALYEAVRDRAPVWDAERDRAAMRTLRDAYAVRGGTSLPLVDAWIQEVTNDE